MTSTSKLPPGLLRPLKPEHPYVKLGVHGPYASGKSWLIASVAAELARELARREGGAPRGIAWLGSEFAASELVPIFAARDGLPEIPVLHRDTRAVGDLEAVMGAARAGEFSIVCLDTETHFFEDWRAEMKAQIGLTKRSPSAGELGEMNAEWRRRIADPMRADPVHYLCAFRQGQSYETTVDEETLRRESHTGGAYARGEKDTGNEKNLMVRLDRLELEGKLVRRAFVEKDRTNKIHGATFDNPSWESLKPAILARLDYAPTAKQGPSLPAPVVFHGPGSSSREREREARKTILLEEIEAWLEETFPGKSKDTVSERAKVVGEVFGTPSTTFVRGLALEQLEAKHAHLHRILAQRAGASAPLSVALEPERPVFVGGPVSSPVPEAPSRSGLAALVGGDAFLDQPISSAGGSALVHPVGAAPATETRTPVHQDSAPQAAPAPLKPEIVSGTPVAVSVQNCHDDGGSSSGSETPGVSKTHDAGPAPDSSSGQRGPEGVASPGPATSSCFFCSKPVARDADRWLLLPLPVTHGKDEDALAEGLHRAAPGFAHAALAPAPRRGQVVVLLERSECKDVCGPCGERESQDGGPDLEGEDLEDAERAFDEVIERVRSRAPDPEMDAMAERIAAKREAWLKARASMTPDQLAEDDKAIVEAGVRFVMGPDDEGYDSGPDEIDRDREEISKPLSPEFEEACRKAEAAPMPGLGLVVGAAIVREVAASKALDGCTIVSPLVHYNGHGDGKTHDWTPSTDKWSTVLAEVTCADCLAALGPQERAVGAVVSERGPTTAQGPNDVAKTTGQAPLAFCPRNECDGSGFHEGGRCLCKTGIEPPKPTPAPLAFEEARSRLGTFTKNADAVLRDVLAGEPSSVSPGLAKRVLDLADKGHERAVVNHEWLAAGGRLSVGDKGERKRLGLSKVSRGLLRVFLSRLPILETAQDRQSPEKDDEAKKPSAPMAEQEASTSQW